MVRFLSGWLEKVAEPVTGIERLLDPCLVRRLVIWL
jgi:hypothetical protein